MATSEYSHLPDLPPLAAFARRWGRRLAILAAVLLAAFVVLELTAGLLLPRRSTRYLLKGQSEGQAAWIDNQFFPYRFYAGRMAPSPLPVVARKKPEPGTLRVCLLGGSAAMGGTEPAFGIGRLMELLLRHRYPGHSVEVVQMAFDGANSHVLREAARDLKRLRPQAVVVLAGNDEVAGPYGPASGLGRWHHSATLARLMVLFSRTRQSQLFMALVNRLFPARVDLDVWRSQEPISLRGRMSPDDPRLQTAFRSFHRNLSSILRQAADASPVVIVSTVPVNLRDCAPFSTIFPEDESIAQEVRENLRAAIAAEAATNLVDAARLYAKVIRRHPAHAEALFRAGRMALNEHRIAEANALFSRARDVDALRLRADSTINAIIRQDAARNNVSLFDAEALFKVHSPQGIPGHELFLDHIHFTFDGNYLLALALIHRMEFLQAFEPEPSGSVSGPETLAGELLYDPWGKTRQLDTVINRLVRAPFRRQLNHAETLARLTREKSHWESRVAAISPDNTRTIFERRRTAHPDDPWLAAWVARYLVTLDRPVEAEAAAHTAYQHWPHRYEIRGLLALTQSLQGQDAEKGITLICGKSGRDNGYFDVEQAIAIGRGQLKHNGYDAVRPWLEYALERDPWNSEAAIALAKTLYHLNESMQSVQLLQSAVQRNPDNPLLWEELGSLYCVLGRWGMATRCYEKSEQIAPYRYERFLKWAEALYRLRQFSRARRPIQRYLEAIPDDPEGLALQEKIKANLPTEPEEEQEPEEEKKPQRFPWE